MYFSPPVQRLNDPSQGFGTRDHLQTVLSLMCGSFGVYLTMLCYVSSPESWCFRTANITEINKTMVGRDCHKS